jgi:hypothetical protein
MISQHLYNTALRYIAEYEAVWDEALKLDAYVESGQHVRPAQRVADLRLVILSAQKELRSLLASY